MSSRIRVIIADDHEVFREGFAGLFRDSQEIEVIDGASNGAQLVNMVSTLKPDVVVTDIQMPEMDGIEATKIIHQKFPEIPVIGLSMFDNTFNIISMLSAGAIGFLVKNTKKPVITEAIKAAYAGKNYYCRTASQLLSALISTGRYDPKKQISLDFTETEFRIIRLICDGKDSKQIAAELRVSERSIDKYRMEIWEKADVKSTVGLIMWAVRSGIYKP